MIDLIVNAHVVTLYENRKITIYKTIVVLSNLDGMIMPYRGILNTLISNGFISGLVILDSVGNIWWHTGFFPQFKNYLLDGYKLLSEWVCYPESTKVCGVPYTSFINSYPDYWILKSNHEKGSIILQLCPKNKYYFLCYTKEGQNPFKIQQKVAEMAELFG
ncbi:MAG: hypothetical protein ACFFAU_17105 [Candidatus Hodarchaeota archaeon]